MRKRLTSLLLCLSIIISLTPIAFAGTSKSAAASITLTNENGIITAELKGNNGKSGDMLILAECGLSGALKNIQTADAVKGAKLTAQKQNGRIYKAFAMNTQTMKPLCENAIYGEDAYTGSVKVPYIDGAVAAATTTAVREYTDARLLVEELLSLDINAVEGDSEKLNEYIEKVKTAIAAYDDVMRSAAVLYNVSDVSMKTQNAELMTMEDEDLSVMATEAEQLHWAEELTKKYDSIKGARKLKALGEMLGCDAREAYEQLAAAQDILRGKYMGDAEAATRWIKGLTVVKTGCKVGLLVGATVATYGAGGATLLEATGLIVNGVDTVIDVEKTTATVILGDDHHAVKNLEKKTQFVSDTAFVFSILTLDGASVADKIAFLGDVNERAREKMGYSIDELQFKMMGGDLIMDVSNKTVKNKEFEETMTSPTLTGKDEYENLSGGKDRLDDNRPEVTDELLKDILDEGDVIDKGSSEKEYDKLFDSFDSISGEALAEKKSEEKGEDVQFHRDTQSSPTYKSVTEYYTNADGKKVGTYRRYSNGVLVELTEYDDNGNYLYFTAYHYPSGRISHYYTYTDGTNSGSVITQTHYYFEDSDIAKMTEPAEGRIKTVEQWICVPYYDSEGKPDGVTQTRYYGNHYSYGLDGMLKEHHYGGGGDWTGSEYYNADGDLECDVFTNGDGTHTVRTFYTTNYTDIPFEIKGQLQTTTVCMDWNYGYSRQSRYSSGDEGVVSSDNRRICYKDEYIYNDDGRSIGYYKVYGYEHTGKNTVEYFEEITREGPFYYNN